jgi:hypothetical protein
MIGEVKKYYHKYKYLTMEIEELQEEISTLEKQWMDEYRPKITNSPRFVDNTEELQEAKHEQPKLDNTKLKPLYKKLSKKLHPDKGGDNDDFIKFKEEYEKGNYFGLTDLAIENDIELGDNEIDTQDYINQIQSLEKQLKSLNENTFLWFYRGTKEQQLMAKYYFEYFYNTKIFEDTDDQDPNKRMFRF